MAEDKIMTDNDLAMANIFGKPAPIPVEPVVPETPETESDEPVVPPVVPTEESIVPPVSTEEPIVPPVDSPVEPVVPTSVDYESIPEEKFLELINKKFNVNFDTVDSASQTLGSQIAYRRQEDIIKKLVEKQKENNVLSYFGSENSYKVNQLAKEYPGKESTLTRVIGSDVSELSDFEVIELAERMAKPAGTKVDVLGVKLRTMGITDSKDDFADWDEMDKQVVIGAAEDARETLKQLQSKITVPAADGGEVDEFVTELESGFRATEEEQKKLIETNTPIAESLVSSLTKIKPVEGSDFEFDVSLDAESVTDLTNFLVTESIEGKYNINADSDIRKLQGMLEQEIWATDGPKIMKAYGKHVEDKTWAAANVKFGNETPLDNPVPPADPNAKTEMTDDDRARAILGR